jgi:hypothetical protein
LFLKSARVELKFDVFFFPKEFVAHEKFQQLLHKKWGQRDKRVTDGGVQVQGYNIFWSEMTAFGKLAHVLQQVSEEKLEP